MLFRIELETDDLVENKEKVLDIYKLFSVNDCLKIKEFEQKCNHDVKSVEYLQENNLVTNFQSITNIHFGLTSQDINNTSFIEPIKDYVEKEYQPIINKIITSINENHDLGLMQLCYQEHMDNLRVPSTWEKNYIFT